MRAHTIAAGQLAARRLSWSAMLICFLELSFCMLLRIDTSRAQATPPITSSGLNTQINLSPAPPAGRVQYDITGGTRPGSGPNLFHSFGEFGVPANNIANFFNETNLPTSNILGRVTDGNPSSILGTIQTTGFGNANLFLINPAGIIFGSTATLNVGGSVAFSTANYLRHTDGMVFNAVLGPQGDILSSAPVAAFGFLGSAPASISIQGSGLTVPTNQSISLVGGNITMTGGRLTAPGGQIRLASVASAGEILSSDLQAGPNLNNESFTSMGNITLSSRATLNVTGTSGGKVSIRGGEFVMDNAFVTASTTSGVSGAPIALDVNTQGDVVLRNGSAVLATTTGAGATGGYDIRADNVQLLGGSRLVTTSRGGGQAGSIQLTVVDTLSVSGVDSARNGSRIASEVESTGNGGAVSIHAGTVSISDRGVIRTRTVAGGLAGDVTLDIDNLTITNGGAIETQGSGAASSGTIRIQATDVVLSGQFDSVDTASRILNTNQGAGGTGVISIETGELILTNGARIRNDTSSDPNSTGAAKIRVSASEGITISGGSRIAARATFSDVGALELSAPTITVTDLGAISTTTVSTGNAGMITLNSENVSVTKGGKIVSTTEQSSGQGGAIHITASNSVVVSGEGSGLFSESLANASGRGGDITVRADQVEVTNKGRISTMTLGTGDAGSIVIEGTTSPAQSLIIGGPGSGLFTETSGTGAGGDITAWSEQLQLTDSAMISSRTTGQMANAGDAGDILIKADDITISGGATITAASTGTGNAGTVTIQGTNSPARSVLITGAGSGVFSDTSGTGTGGDILVISDSARLTDGGTISAATSGTNAAAVGGTIGIEATDVRIENGALVTAASTGQGKGGNIGVQASQTFENNGGTISTAASLADAGSIAITAGQSARLDNGATISTRSTGPGNAGDIFIDGGRRFEMRNSAVTAQAAQAAGGFIDIRAVERVRLENSLISTSVLGGSGSGGNIFIDPQFIWLQNSSILAQAVFGNGGNITLVTPLLLLDGTSLINASSQFGQSGQIQAPTSNLAGTVSTLPSSMRQAQSLQTGRCAALANSQSSSFLIAGRDTIPAEPGGWQPSPFALAGDGTGLAARGKGHENLKAAPPMAMAEGTVSLRRLTPAGFLTQSFAEDGSTGCRA